MCKNAIKQGSGGVIKAKVPDSWRISATIKSPVAGKYPKGKIKIHLAQTKGKGGTTLFSYTQFGDAGEEPTKYLLTGKSKTTYYLMAKSLVEPMWRSREAVEVQLEAFEPVTKEVVLAPPYAKVQFIAYDINTGEYRGLDDPSAPDYAQKVAQDMKDRCLIMKKAIEEAYGNGDVKNDDPETLKIFMAPEFYFRGKAGAYPVEALSALMDEMRLETNDMKYKDWLFIFGTALGYLEHEKSTTKFNDKILLSKNLTEVLFATEGVDFDLTGYYYGAYRFVGDKPEFDVPSRSEILTDSVTGPYPEGGKDIYEHELIIDGPKAAYPEDCEKLAISSDPIVPQVLAEYQYLYPVDVQVEHKDQSEIQPGWYLKQGAAQARVLKVEKKGGSIYDLEVKGSVFSTGNVEVIEPGDTEIFNIAMVQKGGVDTSALTLSKKEFREVLVYKENISSVDFKAPDLTAKGDFYGQDVHLIQMREEKIRKVIPTAGAERGQVKANIPGRWHKTKDQETGEEKWTKISEYNKSGLGGGSVFTIDDITFGLEVCLDHGQARLKSYYDKKRATKNEPIVQVQLIPSCGMSIVNPCLGDKELIFNVDAGQCAVKKAGGTSNVAATSITPVGSIPAGMTFDEYFNQDREIMPDNGASKKSKKGYIVVYPLLDLPPKAKVT